MRPGADNLGTVRDIVSYDDVNDEAVLRKHVVYDGFGNVTDETYYDESGTEITSLPHAEAVDQLFFYTGRAFDEETGSQNNSNRWYDPAVGRWLSEDPIGFEAGDANVYRYVGNFATGAVDPDGLNAQIVVGYDPKKAPRQFVTNVKAIELELQKLLAGAGLNITIVFTPTLHTKSELGLHGKLEPWSPLAAVFSLAMTNCYNFVTMLSDHDLYNHNLEFTTGKGIWGGVVKGYASTTSPTTYVDFKLMQAAVPANTSQKWVRAFSNVLAHEILWLGVVYHDRSLKGDTGTENTISSGHGKHSIPIMLDEEEAEAIGDRFGL